MDEAGLMLLVIASVAVAWLAVALLVVGCCLSASEGDGFGWAGNPAGQAKVRLLRARRTSAKVQDRSHTAA